MTSENDRGQPEDTAPDAGEMSEDEIDLNLMETFPASDPPSWTLGVKTGKRPSRRRGATDEGLKETP